MDCGGSQLDHKRNRYKVRTSKGIRNNTVPILLSQLFWCPFLSILQQPCLAITMIKCVHLVSSHIATCSHIKTINTHSTYLTTLIDVHAHSQSLNRTLPVLNSSTLTQPPNHLQTVVHCMLPCLFTPTQKCLPYGHTLYLRIQYLFCHTNIYSTYVHPSHAHSHPPPYSSLTTSLYTSHDMEEVRYALEPDPL